MVIFIVSGLGLVSTTEMTTVSCIANTFWSQHPSPHCAWCPVVLKLVFYSSSSVNFQSLMWCRGGYLAVWSRKESLCIGDLTAFQPILTESLVSNPLLSLPQFLNFGRGLRCWINQAAFWSFPSHWPLIIYFLASKILLLLSFLSVSLSLWDFCLKNNSIPAIWMVFQEGAFLVVWLIYNSDANFCFSNSFLIWGVFICLWRILVLKIYSFFFRLTLILGWGLKIVVNNRLWYFSLFF